MLARARIAPEVADALAEGRPVVALESTLIAHGLPWPANFETAWTAEAAVRAAGAVPATVAVLKGVVHVGLTMGELEAVANAGAASFAKAGRRDLGVAVARGLDAATTVSATLAIARSVGIGAIATGGLGGVHRGAAETFDVSTDLDELARADGTLVVCSGVKSILDVAATLEAMETRGIAVVGYMTNDFPAFTTTRSGLAIEWRVDSPAEAAAIVVAHRAMGLPGAIVLAQAVDEEVGVPRAEMDAAIAGALAEAHERGVAGKAITPFLLDFVRTATGGWSLIANRALIVANARLAAEVAAQTSRSPA
jgi:pseudouridylate synthase